MKWENANRNGIDLNMVYVCEHPDTLGAEACYRSSLKCNCIKNASDVCLVELI
jgi:hypothetical protein